MIRPVDASALAELPPNFHISPYARPDTSVLHNITFPLFLRKLNADLYHIPLNFLPFFMPRPYVVTIHDMSSFLFGNKKGFRENVRLYKFRRGLMRADCVIAVSASTRRDVENLLGVPASRIETS